jgi:2-desacetyl-2-hydroxyethyl bacteriochlorophyllide A dehydrogenase
MSGTLPDRMRAAVYRGRRDLVVEDRPLPELGPHDVLLEVSHCGICGTDLHMVLEGMARPGAIGGHEFSGRIVALGSEVEGWQLGEGVTGGPSPACGRCAACLAGRSTLCAERSPVGGGDFQGAFAEYARVHDSQLLRVPEGLSLRAAALMEPLAVALHGLTLARISPEQRVHVSGAGPIGLLTVAALKARGVEDVRVTEPAAARRERAAKLGARAFEPEKLELPPLPFTLVDDPVDAVLECSGHPAAMEAGLAQLRRAGTLVFVGTGMRRPRLDHNRILLNELVVTGAFCYDDDGCRSALELLASGRLDTEALIEPEAVGLEGMLGALEELEAGRLAAKVMVVPREEG